MDFLEFFLCSNQIIFVTLQPQKFSKTGNFVKKQSEKVFQNG